MSKSNKHRQKARKPVESDTHFCHLRPHHHHHHGSEHGQHPFHHHHHLLDEHGRSNRETLMKRSWKVTNIDKDKHSDDASSAKNIEHIKEQLLDSIDQGTISLKCNKRQSITIRKINGEEIPMAVSWENDPVSTGNLSRFSLVFRHMIEPRLKVSEATSALHPATEEKAGISVGFVPFFRTLIDDIPGKFATVTSVGVSATVGILGILVCHQFRAS